jgi:hypothetical protein
MANPNNGQLPPYEYIELLNNGKNVLQLNEYHIIIGANSIPLPTYRLAPQQYVLLCAEAALSDFDRYGNILPLNKWPALNNNGATISLTKNGNMEDSVSYTTSWYQSTTKRSGGWSLERINPNISCSVAANWSASVNPMGGTPGKINSVMDTQALPKLIVNDWVIDKNRLSLSFNMPLTDFSITVDNFELAENRGKPIAIQYVSSRDSIHLDFPTAFEQNTLYRLQFTPFSWCSHLLPLEELPLFRQGILAYNDVVINEILFNPKEGGVDFVELFNNCGYPINLQGWLLGSRQISTEMLLIHPGQHLALSIAANTLYQQYPTSPDQCVHEMPSFPAFPNQQGNVLLYAGKVLIDSLYYNASMQQPFLKNMKGISLERQHPDHPTNENGNFISASTLSGGATPGYQNSVQSKLLSKKNIFFLTSKTVSPDDDSYEDFLEINYELAAPNYMINVYIYNDKGTLINRLIRQQSAGISGKITWDCQTQNGSTAPPGIYIYHIEIYDSNAHREVKKGGFVITRSGAGT